MNKEKNHYLGLDILRIISCLVILLYHLNILKGGFLAVCSLFVLSGYLSVKSAFKEEKFSFKDYYIKRIKNIYIPLIIVVFITIGIISLLPKINWLNLKPETTSVLLGYNNHWQLNANLDYFTQHINSPFIHFWYIAILLQFDIIFPFIFLILKKTGEKIHKIVPCIVTIIISLILFIFFCYSFFKNNLMTTYYSTLTRIFSIFFGVTLGFIHNYYPSKKEKENKIIYCLLTIILIVLFVFAKSSSKLLPLSMFLVSFITIFLIHFSINYSNINNKFFRNLASFTYEIYLVQYPIIFLFQEMSIPNYLKLGIEILTILVIAFIIHFSLSFKNKKLISLKIILTILLTVLSGFGIYKYIIAKDYTAEMKALEKQLSNNEKAMIQRQKKYEKYFQQEQDNWNKILEELNANEENLKDVVSKLSVVGIGDSVMLGAINDLYDKFPNGYFDAKISRTAWVANNILIDLKKHNMLGEIIIFNLGANGDCPKYCKDTILNTIGNREIFWLNVTNDNEVHVNKSITEYANNHENIHVIDWESLSKNHPEYFVADGIHLTLEGRKAYTDAIFNEIYNYYLSKYQKEKDAILLKHEQEEKEKISFYGNSLLLNIYPDLETNYPTANFTINQEFNYQTLLNQIKTDILSNKVNYQVVLAFDKTLSLSTKETKELLKVLENHKVYLCTTSNQDLKHLDNDNVILINIDLNSNPDYLMPDKIHLTSSGNEYLMSKLKESLSYSG